MSRQWETSEERQAREAESRRHAQEIVAASGLESSINALHERIATLEQENERLAGLAYIDPEHRFEDATWKNRVDELVTDRRAAEARYRELVEAIGKTIKGWHGMEGYGSDFASDIERLVGK